MTIPGPWPVARARRTEGEHMTLCYTNAQTNAVADVIQAEIAYLRKERDTLQGRLDRIVRCAAEHAGDRRFDPDGRVCLNMIGAIAQGDR